MLPAALLTPRGTEALRAKLCRGCQSAPSLSFGELSRGMKQGVPQVQCLVEPVLLHL